MHYLHYKKNLWKLSYSSAGLNLKQEYSNVIAKILNQPQALEIADTCHLSLETTVQLSSIRTIILWIL